MTKEAERNPLVASTPKTDHFLEELQQQTGKDFLRDTEWNIKVKQALAKLARGFAELGYFDRIPTIDLFSSKDTSDENDKNPGELGLVINVKEDPEEYVTIGGVVLTPEGILLKGRANDGLLGEKFSFCFEGAKEVSPQKYLELFDVVVQKMRWVVDEKTGVHAAERKREQEEGLAKYIRDIEEENHIFGVEGAKFTGTPRGVDKANEFVQRIAGMRNEVTLGNKNITLEQLENLLGHIFVAQQYLESESLYRVNTETANEYGARELTFMAGILISSIDMSIGEELYQLVVDMWEDAPMESGHLVRRANNVPHREEPENKKIYDILKECHDIRFRKGEEIPFIPKFEQPPTEIVTEKYGTISSEEIVDWLLNVPVEKSTSL